MSVFLLLVIGWCFLVGASVGSFLNVVAWRAAQWDEPVEAGVTLPTLQDSDSVS